MAHATESTQPQYETISKFDRQYAGLLGGNNLPTKATTIEDVNQITGETETYIVQTIRSERGDHIVLKYMDKDGVKRLILPPRAAATIERQHNALSAKSRSVASKAAMAERMARGEQPGFMRRGKGKPVHGQTVLDARGMCPPGSEPLA